MYNPQELLFQSVIGEGTVDPSQKADDILTHNENWQDKYSQVYLNDTVGQSYSSYSSYWSILSGILTDPDSPKDDFLIPYTEEDIAVLYKEESGTFYFWMPYHGSRLKVYDDNGTVVFESDFVKDFGDGVQLETMESIKDELETTAQETREKVDQLKETVYRDEKVYGFHIDSSESDPYECVTYLADAVNMTPAKMDFTNDTFNWGSWGNAFFLPKPCMLRYDGTVDYYLNPNDYSKKEDGTASDVSDFSYPGNAMMEWGQNGKKIWYKIVPDTDPSSASVYIASYQVDEDYRCWSFINNQGKLAEHFYTPIYNGSIDTAGRLRSISGKTYSDLCQSKTVTQEVAAAELNNPSTDKLWYTEVFSDITIINFLLILIGKSLNTQATFGNGVQGQASASTSMISTGTMNSKGLFWGDDDNTHGVKTFGMENWWGNQNRRFAGLVMNDYVTSYKMTRGRQDGTTADDYNTSGNGYLAGITCPNTSDFVKKMQFDANGFLPKEVTGTSSTYWCDSWYQNSGERYAARGGSAYTSGGNSGAFCVFLYVPASNAVWRYGAAPSCKPLPPVWRTLGPLPIISFDDGSLYPLKDMSVNIVPVQDLHGYDKPWAPGAGKNKLLPHTGTYTTSLNGITLSYSDADEGITISGTNEKTDAAWLIINGLPYVLTTLESGKTYYFGHDLPSTGFYAQIAYRNTSNVVKSLVYRLGTGSFGCSSFTLPEDFSSISGFQIGALSTATSIPNKSYHFGVFETDETSWSPYSNICPITGFDSAVISRTGKNLVKTKDTGRTNADIVYTVNADGTIRANGTASATSWLRSGSTVGYATYLKAGTYKLTGGKSASAQMYVVGYYINGTTISNSNTPGGIYDQGNGKVFTLPTDAYVTYQIQIANGTEIDEVFYPMIRPASITDDTFEPCVTGTYNISFTSAGTVYGGTLDVVNGLLTVDRKSITFVGSNDEGWLKDTTYNYFRTPLITDAINENASPNNSQCNLYPYGTIANGSDTKGYCLIWATVRVRLDDMSISLDDWKQSLSTTPLQVVYKLATPLTYELSATEVSTIMGYNNIWTNTGDSTLTYKINYD